MEAERKLGDIRLRVSPSKFLGMLTLVVIYALPLVTFWGNFAPPTSMASKAVHAPQNVPGTYVSPTPLPETYQGALEVQAIAQKYMRALLAQNYTEMWSLLHPNMQAKWRNEGSFATFWRTRFQDYTLQGFSLGHVQPFSFWVDPETMAQYKGVEELPVSLQLQPKLTSTHAQLPPENLHPSQVLQDLPFIVQRDANQNDKNRVWFVLAGGPADLEAPILPPMNPVNRSLPVPILAYHHISDTLPTSSPSPWTLTIAHFNQQMDALRIRGYHTITFSQLFDALYYGASLPPKPIILTFDDGYEDAYQYAYPILRAHHFSGMFYIITGRVGLPGYMTWAQLNEMLARGMQMGSHTITHPNLAQTLLTSYDQAVKELQQSQLTLQKNLGIVVQQFCYPYGEPFYRGGWVQRQQVVALLAEDGYVGATTAVGVASGIEQSSVRPFILPRIVVLGYESFSQFAQSLPW